MKHASSLLFTAALISVAAPSLGNGATIDEILARLEALEQENSVLREEMRKLQSTTVQLEDSLPAALIRSETTATHSGPADEASSSNGPGREPWDRTYIGVHGSYQFGELDYTRSDDPDDAFGHTEFDIEDFAGGAHLGHTWQWRNLVAGLELDGTLGGPNGSADRAREEVETRPFFLPGVLEITRRTESVELDTEIKWQMSVVGRIGLAWSNLLVYGSGGLSAAHLSVAEANSTSFFGTLDPDFLNPLFGFPFTSSSQSNGTSETTQIGFTGGGGAEYLVTDAVSFGVDYRFTIFDEVMPLLNGSENHVREIEAAFHTASLRANFGF